MSQAATQSQERAERPIAEVREGGVKIAIWQRNGSEGPFFVAGQPKLSYNKDGQWQESNSYSEFDIVDLIVAASKAKSEIRKLRRATQPQTAEDGEQE
jgi:hypothetical protein